VESGRFEITAHIHFRSLANVKQASASGPVVDKACSPRPLRQGFDASSVINQGNIAMLFGLLCIPLVAMIGLAVDFGRVYSVTSRTQAALDAAALATGRAAQLNPNNPVNAASTAATACYNQAKPQDVVSTTL
jgi:Flp pilus assembly protein TadG